MEPTIGDPATGGLPPVGGSPPSPTEPVLIAEGLAKRYPGVVALGGVDFSLMPGEVRALLGKNGAGKSTLVKILSGAIRPDRGTIRLAGKPVTFADTAAAQAAGIAIVYQELSLVPGLGVAENIMLGRWRRTTRFGIPTIDWRAMVAEASAALETLGIAIPLDLPVDRLSIANQQLIEIAKAVSFRPRVLILDEPTSSLPQQEVEVLLALVRRLAAQGVAVVYVSHRMQEIPRIADSLTVLRDGLEVGTLTIAAAPTEKVTRMMIGREERVAVLRSGKPAGRVALSVRGLSRAGRFTDVSFDLHEGEVLGLAGLLGSGRTEVLRAIFGLDRADTGTIVVGGEVLADHDPVAAIARGIGFTPEDRKREGLVLVRSVAENLVLACLRRIAPRRVIERRQERQLASAMRDRLAIATRSLETPAGQLSGGNQQKIVIGKWLNAGVRILLLDEPTRGIDVEAKAQIYDLVREMADRSLSVIFVSSELEELPAVCDRVLVLNGGRVTAEVSADALDVEGLQALAMQPRGTA